MELIQFYLNPINDEEFEIINSEHGKTKSKIPFIKLDINYRETVIRMLEITAKETTDFPHHLFRSDEQEWLVETGFLGGYPHVILALFRNDPHIDCRDAWLDVSQHLRDGSRVFQ